MKTRIVLAVALLALAACGSPPQQPPAPPPAPRPAPPPPPQANDQCHASEYRNLVGQPRTKIPVPLLPALQRVACTTCPVTMDYNPRRLNFFYDAGTGIIKEVRCG